MLVKIISGGETGADQAAWRAAEAYRVSTGGWMPGGFLTEDGPRPEFGERYGALELPTDDRASNDLNVQDSDATLWFGETTTSVAHRTVRACQKLGKSCMPVSPDASFQSSHVATWILENKIRTLNVTGNNEGEEFGIGDRVESFLGEVLQQLGYVRT
jgi:Circularly permutated YpsA SLOG family